MAHCLSLDLGVGVKDGRIHALAGVRADTGECLTLSVTRLNLANALTRLHELADGAGFLLGHNLIDFDLHHLRATNPDLRLLTLPAVDTLRLNPLLSHGTPTTTWSSATRTVSGAIAGETTRSWTPGSPWNFSAISWRRSGTRPRVC